MEKKSPPCCGWQEAEQTIEIVRLFSAILWRAEVVIVIRAVCGQARYDMSTPPLSGGGMAGAPGGFPAPPPSSAPREVNTASLCRIGQETVQDIVFRTMEIFQLLRNMQVSAAPRTLRAPFTHPRRVSADCIRRFLPWKIHFLLQGDNALLLAPSCALALSPEKSAGSYAGGVLRNPPSEM